MAEQRLTPRTEPPATGAWRPGDPVGDRKFHTVATPERPFRLESGGLLTQVDIAYETWGKLDEFGQNAILVCHALTGDAHAARGQRSGATDDGWWEGMIGPDRAIDTNKYFVVCSNVLGGCQGSTGPASINPETNKPYGSEFPLVSIRDMVRAQASLANGLGIGQWLAVVGGSMGGMQALEWAVMYPERVHGLITASSTAAASPMQIAWSRVGRHAIESDVNFNGGDYYDRADGQGPHQGLSVARMAAQVTYRSNELFDSRFDRGMNRPFEFTTDSIFDIETYLDYHGDKLVRRFDANSYLRLNRSMDFHDVGRGRGSVNAAIQRSLAHTLTVAISSDYLYPPVQQQRLYDDFMTRESAREYHTVNRYVEIESPHGHDGFLLEINDLSRACHDFLEEIRW